ncbi:hypothetical protein ADK38_33395, partial [Streptomyces varsoviensis]
LYGHDGNTIGQSAFLRVLPDQGLAVTLLTNGGNARDLYQELFREIFAEIAGVAMPAPLAPAARPAPVDAARHAGVYERAGARADITYKDGRLTLLHTVTGPLAAYETSPAQEAELLPADDGRSGGNGGQEAAVDGKFVFRMPGTRTWVPVTFYTLETGEQYVHYGARATPKVS